jgi:F-type H+-transporting ATPase subunit b
MSIDWITVAAQIVNFLILVALLKRFLYAPILGAMDRREAAIAARLEEARQKLVGAEEQARTYRERSAELDRRRDELLDAARAEAEALRRSLEDEVRQDVEQRRRKWLDALRSERESVRADVRRLAARQFDLLARRALADLADRSLEAQMAEVFVARLQQLDEDTRRALAESVGAAPGRLVIDSTLELSAAARKRITQACHEIVGDGVEIDYRTTSSLTCGIALEAGGYRVAWSLDGYLDGLEERWAEALEERTAG